MHSVTRYRPHAGALPGPGRRAPVRLHLLIMCLAALLLLIQELELTHSHAGLPERQANCEICVKLGSASDLLATAYSVIPAFPAGDDFLPVRGQRPVLRGPVPRSRAPPAV